MCDTEKEIEKEKLKTYVKVWGPIVPISKFSTIYLFVMDYLSCKILDKCFKGQELKGLLPSGLIIF